MTSSAQLYNASEFYIPTLMSQMLHETIQNWLWCGFTGGLVLGESRTGKSRAIQELSTSIPSRIGQGVPIHRVIFGERDNKTIREAWMKIAKSTGINPKNSRVTAEELSSQVAFWLTEAAMQNDTHQVILISDEVQFLSIMQLSVFAELHNMLNEEKVNCLMIFVANQDTFSPMASALMRPENKYIRERFFNNVHLFYGIKSSLELQSCLKFLDQGDTEHGGYHKDSLTESCIPEAFRNGFRLHQMTDLIWELYNEQFKGYGSSQSWGMEYFSRFIKILLLDYLPRYDCQSEAALKSMVIHSLNASGIKSMLSSVYG